MASTIKAVLFDLDDTLFDHHYSMQKGVAAVHQNYAILQAQTLPTVEATYMSFIDKWHLKVLDGTLTLAESRAERFRDFFAHHGEQISLEEAVTAAEIYRAAYQESRQLISGAQLLLQHLRERGIKIVIITNNTVEEQITKLAHLGITNLIDILVISEEVGKPKPHRAIFEAALERSQCQPHEVVMVGDSWSNDVVGAHRLGIRAVWVNRFGHAIPDQSMAAEITSLEPLETLAGVLLGT
jgi:putative hydrolase of the HAD superfamily